MMGRHTRNGSARGFREGGMPVSGGAPLHCTSRCDAIRPSTMWLVPTSRASQCQNLKMDGGDLETHKSGRAKTCATQSYGGWCWSWAPFPFDPHALDGAT